MDFPIYHLKTNAHVMMEIALEDLYQTHNQSGISDF
jgi:hypothetical protein